MDTTRELVFWESLRYHPDIEIMCVKKKVVLLMPYVYSFDVGTGFKPLKVPKCEISDRSDFPDFNTIKSRREGDFGVKKKKF